MELSEEAKELEEEAEKLKEMILAEKESSEEQESN